MDQHTTLICRACGREFASREQFDKHEQAEHSQNAKHKDELPRYSASTRADREQAERAKGDPKSEPKYPDYHSRR